MKKRVLCFISAFLFMLSFFSCKTDISAKELEGFEFRWNAQDYYEDVTPDDFSEWSTLIVNCAASDYNRNTIVAVIGVMAPYKNGNPYASEAFNQAFAEQKKLYRNPEKGGLIGNSMALYHQNIIYTNRDSHPNLEYVENTNISFEEVWNNYASFETIYVDLDKVNEYCAAVRVPAGFVYYIDYGCQVLYDNPDDFNLYSEDGLRYKGTVFGDNSSCYFYAEPGGIHSLTFGFGAKYSDKEIKAMQTMTYEEKEEEIRKEEEQKALEEQEPEEKVEEPETVEEPEETEIEEPEKENKPAFILNLILEILTGAALLGFCIYFIRKQKKKNQF